MRITENEIWVDIPGYEGLFQVSQLGRVKNIRLNKLVNQYTNRDYSTVRLTKNSKTTTYYVHRLVAFAFQGRPDDLLQVDHIDGNKHNNHSDNLRWVTRKQNMASFLAGKEGKVIRKKFRCFAPKDVVLIRGIYTSGKYSQHALAKKFGVDVMVINRLINKKTYADVH